MWLWEAYILENVDRMLAGYEELSSEEAVLLSIEEEEYLRQEIDQLFSDDIPSPAWAPRVAEDFVIWEDEEDDDVIAEAIRDGLPEGEIRMLRMRAGR